jgi:phosphinothricin acetyltransferase
MIRTARPSDLDRIKEIYNTEITNNTSVYQESIYSSKDIVEWFKNKRDGSWPVFVYTDKESVCGFATYGTFRARQLYISTVEHSVFVHQQYRGKGIARKLMEHLMADARSRGYHVMIGGIDSENTDSIEFHASLGFTEVGHIKQVARKFGRWLDLKLYQRIIATDYDQRLQQRHFVDRSND